MEKKLFWSTYLYKAVTMFVAWVGLLFSASDAATIKRLTGFLIFCSCLVAWMLVGFGIIPTDTWTKMEYFGFMLLSVGLLMYGINAVLDWKKIDSGVSTGKPPDPPPPAI